MYYIQGDTAFRVASRDGAGVSTFSIRVDLRVGSFRTGVAGSSFKRVFMKCLY